MLTATTEACIDGAKLRELRESAGLSRRELALQARVSAEGIEKIESGQVTDPRISTILALARALGVGLDALVD